MSLSKDFANNLKAFRLKSGLTRKQVIKQLGVSYNTYNRYEKGEIFPSVSKIEKIANLFGVTPIDLLSAPKAELEKSAEALVKPTKEPLSDFEYAALIYCKIFRLDKVDGDIYYDGVLGAIKTLTEREQVALEAYNRQDLTYKQVGQILGVTHVQASNIEQKALRKLCHPTRVWNMRVSRLLENRDDTIQKQADKINDLLSQVKKIAQGEPVGKILARDLRNKKPGIATLGLKPKTYNALFRMGIHKIEDLLAIESYNGLMRIRNFGLSSLKEVIIKMREDGYTKWVEKIESEIPTKQDEDKSA